MAKVVFTPWKTQAQLLAVRDQFYPPPSYDGPDLRSQACAKVSIWKLRGSLPHPVEATALLTDAILHDDAGKNSVFSIRATYAAAFCRFVTGLVDAKIPGMRKTMFQRAIDLGLPASFVELRHEATHRELPSLIVLRNATQRSLEWLWDYYWAKVDLHATATPPVSAPVPADAEENGGDDLGVKESIRDTLSPLAKGEEGEEQQPPRKKRKAQYQTTAATQLVSICKASRKGAVVLSRVLLDESVLVPAGRRLGDSLHDTFIKWEHLLQMITESHSAFLSTLTEEMVNDLAFSTQTKDTKNNAYHEAIYTWLDHILRSTEWKSSRRLLSFSYLLAACEANPNHWTDTLKKVLFKEEAKRTKGAVSVSTQTQTQTQTEAMIVDGNADADAGALRELGWESLELWDSRPLGVA